MYDFLYEGCYRALRRESIARLNPRPGEAVLLIGVGTGADLPLIRSGSMVVALDRSPAMLDRARRKQGAGHAYLLLADGERLPFRDASFDAVVLHLVLSVTPSGEALLAEVSRVTRHGGRIAVCDHFAPGPSIVRRMVNPLAELLGTHVNRTFEALSAGLPLHVTRDVTRRGGVYRLLQLRRQ